MEFEGAKMRVTTIEINKVVGNAILVMNGSLITTSISLHDLFKFGGKYEGYK